MTTLLVNAFYGFAQPLPLKKGAREASINLTFDPFRGTNDGLVPSFLEESLSKLIIEGNEVDRGNGKQHITGTQISRGVAFHALLAQLEALSSVNEAFEEGDMVINISRCGNLGNYVMRYLLGIPNIKVNFIGYTPEWQAALEALEPITVRTKVINPRKRKEAPVVKQDETEYLLSSEKNATRLKESVAQHKNAIEEVMDVVTPAPKKPAAKKKPAVAKEVEVEEAPKAKKLTKAQAAKLPVEAQAEEEPAKKPVAKKPAAKKKVVAASEESLNALSDKFPSKAKK
jgi:chemotaxis protein histidine kinase CheA